MSKIRVGAHPPGRVVYLPIKRRPDRPPSFGVDAFILIASGGLAMWFYTQMLSAGL